MIAGGAGEPRGTGIFNRTAIIALPVGRRANFNFHCILALT
jgi:hypothetical protein